MLNCKVKINVMGLALFALLSVAVTGVMAGTGPTINCTGTKLANCNTGTANCANSYTMMAGNKYYQCQATSSGHCTGVLTLCKTS